MVDSTTGGSLEEESTKNKLADYMERILKDKETTQSIRRSRRTEKKNWVYIWTVFIIIGLFACIIVHYILI